MASIVKKKTISAKGIFGIDGNGRIYLEVENSEEPVYLSDISKELEGFDVRISIVSNNVILE